MRYDSARDRIRKALGTRRLRLHGQRQRLHRRYEIAMDRIVRSDGPLWMFFWIAGWRRAREAVDR